MSTRPRTGGVGGRLVCQVGAQASAIAAWTDVERLALGLVEKPGAEDWAGLHAAWQAAQLVDVTPAMGAPMSPEASSAPPAASSAPPAASSAPPAAVESAVATREETETAPPGTLPEPSTGTATEPAGTMRQWASGATASSQFGETGWSAAQATGPTDTTVYGDQQTAWAPESRDGGPAWLELTYDVPVIPSEVVVFESSGNGFVTSVELWDAATESWITAWEGQDQSPEFVIGFSPDLDPVDFATDRVRVNIDTDVEGWNEERYRGPHRRRPRRVLTGDASSRHLGVSRASRACRRTLTPVVSGRLPVAQTP